MFDDEFAELQAWVKSKIAAGHYKRDVGRFLIGAVEKLADVLEDEEKTTLDAMPDLLEHLSDRFLRKNPSFKEDTARVYVARAKRLLSDYSTWKQDPKTWKPRAKKSVKGKAPASKAAGNGAAAEDAPQPAPQLASAPADFATPAGPDSKNRAVDMVVQVLDLRPGVRVEVKLPRDATPDELRQYVLLLLGTFPQIRGWLALDAMFLDPHAHVPQ